MALREAYARAMADAETLLDTLNGQPSVEGGDRSVGSIARLALAQDTLASLTQELQDEYEYVIVGSGPGGGTLA